MRLLLNARNQIFNSLQEFNQTAGDIITANALAGTNIFSATGINDGLCALDEVRIAELSLLEIVLVDVLVAPGDGLLRGHAVPKTVTRDQDEIVVGLAGYYSNIRASSYSLVLCFHRRIVFVFKIAESAG